MAQNFDFDRVWKQIIDEALEDNIDEEIMRYLRQLQREAESSNQPIRKRRNINQNCEDGHSHLMNDYFSENSIYTESQFDRGSEWENNCSFEL